MAEREGTLSNMASDGRMTIDLTPQGFDTFVY